MAILQRIQCLYISYLEGFWKLYKLIDIKAQCQGHPRVKVMVFRMRLFC